MKGNLVWNHFCPLPYLGQFFLMKPITLGSGLAGRPWNFLTLNCGTTQPAWASPDPDSQAPIRAGSSLCLRTGILLSLRCIWAHSSKTDHFVLASGNPKASWLGSPIIEGFHPHTAPKRLLRFLYNFALANPQPKPKRELIYPEICKTMWFAQLSITYYLGTPLSSYHLMVYSSEKCYFSCLQFSCTSLIADTIPLYHHPNRVLNK